MQTIAWLSPILNILAILAVIAGLYISGKFLPSLIAWVHIKNPSSPLLSQFPKIIIWLALGALFTAPLLDLINAFSILINVTLAAQGASEYPFLLGTVSPRVYFLFPLLLMLGVYALIIYFGKDYISSSKQFRQTERTFIILAIASLIFSAINSVFTQVLSFQAPFLNVQQNFGLVGYLVEILIGIVILAVILFGLNRLLSNHPASRQ
jgi:hypothetical protein